MLNVRAIGDVLVVTPAAPTAITATEARTFDEAASDLPGAAGVVLDLAAVSFVDSAGIACIVRLSRRLNDGGRELRLAGPSNSVSTVLELVRLHRMVEVYPSVGEAVESFGAAASSW